MSRIVWGSPSERFFETGLDRGVLYVGINPGVPWNGLVSVNESSDGGEARPAYIDGYKFRNISTREEFVATLEAFSAPKEFGVCDGSPEIHNGLVATQQPRRAFHLSYRTLIGNATTGTEHGYKIHLIYNALAAPAEKTHSTIRETTEPDALSWSLSTRPPVSDVYRPTAHLVIDSRYTESSAILAEVEDILYGTDAESARMPTQAELLTIFAP